MRAEGLVRSSRFPSQGHLAIALVYVEAVEDRQHTPNMLTNEVEPLQVFLLQPVQHRSKVPAMGKDTARN